MPAWREKYPGVESLNVAVMGCIVNGPGKSKHADIGISLPGTGETPAAPVFIDGEKAATLRGTSDRRRIPGDGGGLHREALRQGLLSFAAQALSRSTFCASSHLATISPSLSGEIGFER